MSITVERSVWYSAELEVAAALSRNSCVISFPSIPTVYDFIADQGGILYRIQVKRATLKHPTETKFGKHDRAAYRIGLWRRDKKAFRTTEFEYLALVCDLDIYMIPTSAVENPNTPGRTILNLVLKPLLPNLTRADSIAAGERWEPYRNNFNLGGQTCQSKVIQ